MPRTAAGLRTGPTTRIADLAAQRPEWGAWLGLLAEVEEVAGRQSPVASRQSPVASPPSPLLHQSVLRIDTDEARQLIVRLAKKASNLENGASLRGYRPTGDEALRLIRVAVSQNRHGVAEMAAARGLDAGALASVAHLAALPLLRASATTLRERIPQYWPHGYCPICAAWPVLAERRGLDRSRRLRCGRCAGEWEIEWLTCVYCGERNHKQLGSLVSEDGDEMLKVETCASCRGYLKSIATLQAIPAFELLLKDLETVELDLVALERGYTRPEKCGFEIEVEVV
jgi:FdhE protein